MKAITIYKKKHVAMELMLSWKAWPWFRLCVPGVSFCYRNPLECFTRAAHSLADYRLKDD